MLALCRAKLVATVFSYASGGAGGIFAPSLFIGGTLGGAVGTLDATLLGHVNEPVGAFALVGMGAVFAGVIRAPMTSVLIIVEMTQGYSLILPLMIANMTAYGLARSWRPKPIYEALLAQDGVQLDAGGKKEALDGMYIETLIDSTGPFPSFSPDSGADQIAGLCASVRPRDVYPVIDDARRLVGIITSEELRMLDSEPELVPLTNAFVRASDTLRTALDRMLSSGVREVPVIDEAGCFVGFVEEATIAHAYLRGQGVADDGVSRHTGGRERESTRAINSRTP
jgi:CIC family chloride channel protein